MTAPQIYPIRLHEATDVELLASNMVEGPHPVTFDAKCDCLHCPRLEACRADVATVTSAGDRPHSMIWAGFVCRHEGTVIATDRELRVYCNRVEGQRAVERGGGGMISLSDRVLLMATGEIECPGTEGLPSLRWNWLADLYSHPVWGLVTIPGFSVSVGCEISMLCRDMPTGTVNSLATRWDAVDRLGAIGASRAQSAALYAWSAVADTTVDAHDYLSGHQFSGAEAVAAAFWAHLAAKPGSVAETCIAAAIEAWDSRLHRPSTRGAVA